MKRISRESWIIIGLLALLLAVTLIAAAYQAQSQARAPALASHSSTQEGAHALWLWLEALGYTVSDSIDGEFQLGPNLDIALILQPVQRITPDEWQAIDAWVQTGGTLVLVGESGAAMDAMTHYGLRMASLMQVTDTLTAQTPFDAPPLKTTATVRARAFLQIDDDQGKYTVHFAAQDKPVVISFSSGDGRVILGTTPFVFSNAGLKNPGNPQVVLGLLSLARRAGTVWFDEWHHGQRAARHDLTGPVDWLIFTPSGHALIYAAAVGFIGLLLWGQRLGRPVPLTKDMARRAPLEYITAMANLSRHAGHRKAVAGHYYHQLKRTLGKRYRLDPTLPDDEYVTRLARYNPGLDAAALRTLLRQLNHPSNETEMIQLAARVAAWLKES